MHIYIHIHIIYLMHIFTYTHNILVPYICIYIEHICCTELHIFTHAHDILVAYTHNILVAYICNNSMHQVGVCEYDLMTMPDINTRAGYSGGHTQWYYFAGIFLSWSDCACAPRVLQQTATHCNSLYCDTLQHAEIIRCTRRTTLRYTAVRCDTRQHTATHCNTLQHTAKHRNTLEQTYPSPYDTLDMFSFI